MTIKERALGAVKQNYAKFGLKAEELDKLATHIASGLTEEATDDELNTSVKGAEFYAEMMQSVGNRKQKEIEKKFEGYVPKPIEVTPPTAPAGLTMEQVQEMIANATKNHQQAIDDAVAKATAPFIKAQEAARLNTLLQGHEKLKDIPQVFREKYRLDKEDDLEKVATQVETDFTNFKQALVSSGAFVEAPSNPTPETEAEDFIKTMQSFSERNAPKN